jgi:chromosome segregation ATPase
LQSFQENVSADLGRVRSDLTANNKKFQQLQESVKSDISGVKSDISSVKADLSARISQLQDANVKFQETFRAESKAESEKLAKRIEQQGPQIRQETSANLDAEARRLINLVGRVQKETEAELVAVKEQIQVVTTGFEFTVEQNTTHTKAVVELANQLVDHRAEVDHNLDKLDQEMSSRFSRQKETLEQVNAKIVALENKFSAAPATAEMRAD